jgi:adenylate cyclase
MAFEIERKFLVRGNEWPRHATGRAAIRQAYLASGERSSTRVRITDGTHATVTIKSKKAELRRLEIEYAVSVPDAEALLSLRQSGLIEKTRFNVSWHGSTWEIDVFSGDNAGLVIAELELQHERQGFEHPPWLGVEVTGQAQYYNGSLARRPYCEWRTAPPSRPVKRTRWVRPEASDRARRWLSRVPVRDKYVP